MKINFKVVLLMLTLVLIMAECKKKSEPNTTSDPTPTPSPSGPNSLTELFAANGTPTSTTQIAAGSNQTITVSGVNYMIPANAFVTQSNGTVTGTIDLITRSVFSKADIILTGAPANSAGKLIATKGCVKTSASQNGQVLRIAPTTTVSVLVPEPNAGNLSFTLRKFYSTKVSVTDSTVCWKPSADTSNIKVDTIGANLYYHVNLDSVNWLNTGSIYYPTGTKTTMTVISPNTSTFNKNNLAVYVTFKAQNIVGALYEVSPGVYKINNIPLGQQVAIIGIGVVNGTYYYYIKSGISVSTNQTDTLNLQSDNMTNIKAQLNLLP